MCLSFAHTTVTVIVTSGPSQWHSLPQQLRQPYIFWIVNRFFLQKFLFWWQWMQCFVTLPIPRHCNVDTPPACLVVKSDAYILTYIRLTSAIIFHPCVTLCHSFDLFCSGMIRKDIPARWICFLLATDFIIVNLNGLRTSKYREFNLKFQGFRIEKKVMRKNGMKLFLNNYWLFNHKTTQILSQSSGLGKTDIPKFRDSA